jgi:hypothetical protein
MPQLFAHILDFIISGLFVVVFVLGFAEFLGYRNGRKCE